MIVETLAVGALKTNCYVVVCEDTRDALVVDPGGDEDAILSAISRNGAQLMGILLSHFHYDHILAADPLRQATGAKLMIHRSEAEWLCDPPALFRYFAPDVPTGLRADVLLEDGDNVTVGCLLGQVLHTPGHSPGGISLWFAGERTVFCGDALFREGIGRTDFPGSSSQTLAESIRRRLYTLPDDTMVYPGHGPATTIGHERMYNPWVPDAGARV